MSAGLGPMADWDYFLMFLLIETAECYTILKDEIRTKFESNGDISIQSTAQSQYLTAFLDEKFRTISFNAPGLPRYSPGAALDAQWRRRCFSMHKFPVIVENQKSRTTHKLQVIVQTSIFNLGQSPRYFHDSIRFRPK